MPTLKELYTALKADGAPLPDTYEKFSTYMTSGPKNGYEHRKQVYDALKSDGAPLPDTYEEFSKALFSPVKGQPTPTLPRGGRREVNSEELRVNTNGTNGAYVTDGKIASHAKQVVDEYDRSVANEDKTHSNPPEGRETGMKAGMKAGRQYPGVRFVPKDKEVEAYTPKAGDPILDKYPWLVAGETAYFNKESKEPYYEWVDDKGNRMSLDRLRVLKAEDEIKGTYDDSKWRKVPSVLELPDEHVDGIKPDKSIMAAVDATLRSEYGDGYLNMRFKGKDGKELSGGEMLEVAAQQEYDAFNIAMRDARRQMLLSEEPEREEIRAAMVGRWGDLMSEERIRQWLDDESGARRDIISMADAQIEDLRAERARITAEMDRRGSEIDKSSSPFVDQSFNGRGVDARYGRLQAELKAVDDAIRSWETVRNSDDAGIMRGLKNTMGNPHTWDFGLSDLNQGIGLVSGSKEERKRLSGLMSRAESASAAEDKTTTDAYRFAKIAGMSMPYAVDFALTGGGFSGWGRTGAKTALNMARKKAVGSLTARLMRNTGMLLGDISSAYTTGMTIQGMKTAGDVLERKSEGAGWVESVYKGTTSAAIENYTELFGGHVNMGKTAMKMLPRIGLGKMNEWLKGLGKTDWYATSREWLRRMGVNGYGGEVLEEEVNIPLSAVLIGESPLLEGKGGLLDADTQKDILGGTAMSIFIMNGATITASGIHKGGLELMRRNDEWLLNKADEEAYLCIDDISSWEKLRDEIDGTPNEKLPAIARRIQDDGSLSEDGKKAVGNYIARLMQTRGHNIGIAFANMQTEREKAEFSAIEPTGSGELGDVYDQFKGDAGKAARFLISRKGGVAKGVLHHKDIGDIDLAWGDESKGLFHMISKHVIENADFDSVAELTASIDDTVSNGEFKNYGDNFVFTKDGYKAVVVRTKEGNYVLTAYDASKSVKERKRSEADATRLHQSIFENGDGHLVPQNSAPAGTGKDNAKNPYSQASPLENDYLHEDDIDRRIKQSNEIITSRVNRETGMIQGATMKQDDRRVYVVAGRIVPYEDGTGIDISASGDSIIIRDAETGALEQVSPEAVLSLDEAQDPDEQRQFATNAIVSEELRIDGANGAYVTNVSESPSPTIPWEGYRPQYALNDIVTLRDENGNSVRGSITADADADGRYEVYTEEPVNGKRVNLFTHEELSPSQTLSREGEVRSETHPNLPEGREKSEELREDYTENGNIETVSKTSPTIQNEQLPMPMVGEGEDAEPDFSKATPQRAHAYIYNEAGLDKEEANQFVEANKKAAGKALTIIQGKKPKMGTSLAKYRKETAEWQQKVSEALTRADYWKQVKDEQQKILVTEAQARAERDAVIHEQAIAEEQHRQEEELRKREAQAQLGSNNVSPQIIEKWNAAPKVDGARNEIILANGERVPGRYVLVESGVATPSHNPTTGFAKNEGFPMDENGQSVNDRDYERDQDAQAITRQIADQYDSRAMQTPVVVSNDGVVLSGNGRTMAGELAAQNGTDGAYIEYLKKYCGQYGFTPEQVDNMTHPRVLFVPDEAMPYTADTFAKFNQQEMKGQSKTEQAVKLGKIVDNATFGRIIQGINGFDSLSDFYNDPAAATDAIAELRNAGAINTMQYAEMFDGEKVSGAGRQMLENMLIGKAFESNPDAVRQLSEFPGMRQSVISALAEISNNIKLGEEYSLENEIAQAIDLAYQARKNGVKAGDPVSWYARQLNLFPFDEGETVADYTNATVLMLADSLNDNRVNMLKKVLALYNRSAVDAAAGQLDMFSGGVKTTEEIIKEVIDVLNYGTKTEQQAALADAREQRKAAAAGQGGTGTGVQQDDVSGRRSRGSENSGRSGGSPEETQALNHDEAILLIAQMEERAEVAPKIELTIENWDAQFGEDGRVVTPIGEVKMGENQFTKLMRQGREGKLGMIKPTLENPDVIIEDARKAKEDDVIERNFSYVFVKAFKKADGSRYYYFTSVTVSKDGKEVVISNQEKRKNAIANLLTNGKLVWKHADDVSAASDVEQGLYSSQGNVSDPTTEGTDAPQTNNAKTVAKTEPQLPNNAVSDGSSLSTDEDSGITSAEPNGEPTVSFGKGSEISAAEQGSGEKIAGSKASLQELRSQYPDRVLGEQHKDGTVEYTFTDGTKANADEVQDAMPMEQETPQSEQKEDVSEQNTASSEQEQPKQAELDEALKEKKRLDDEYKKLSDEKPKADEDKESSLRFRDGDARDIVQQMDEGNGTEVVRFVDFLRRGRLEMGESRYFHVGETGDILNEHGISGKITIGTSAVNSHHNEDADHLDENDWVEVIEKINGPVAITEYGDKGNSYRIYTIVEKNGKNICVGVDVNSVGRDVNITNIRTAFARDIANALNERLVYPHSRTELETAIRELSLRHNRKVYPKQPYDAANIVRNFENPSVSEEKLRKGESILNDDALSDEHDPTAKMMGKLTRTAEKRREFAEYKSVRTESDELKPSGKGIFGNIYNQFKGKVQEAIDFLREKKEGEAVGALTHHTVGEVSIVWGNKKAGLEKILAKHPEVADNLQEIIDSMEVVQESDNRIKLESPSHFAVISKEWMGQPRDKWLLTAYEKKEKSVSDGSMDIVNEPDGKQNDTAPLQNGLSDDKVNTFPPNRQTDKGYSELMKKELEKKEAKYADIDSEMENIDDIVEAEEASEEEETLYRDAEDEIVDANRHFNDELDAFKAKTHKGLLHLGQPGIILNACGINAELTLSPTVLSRKLRQHGLNVDDIKGLARAIQEPILVYQHGDVHPNMVVVTDLTAKGGKVSIAVELDDEGNVVELNNVSSIHSKDATTELERLSNMRDGYLEQALRWVDKNKVSDWLGIADLNNPIHANNPKLVSFANIVRNFENPSVSEEKLREGESILNDDALSDEHDPTAKMMGKSTWTAEKRREFAGRERKRMVERVKELAGKLHLDNVEIVTDVSTLDGRKRRAKGFFSKSTGKITIVVPNHSSLFDVEQTLLHEAVAHYGLRRLFGEHFDTFLDNVFNNADEHVRGKIVELAKRHGWDFRIATEEYLAGLAEDTDFENVNASWWQKIKGYFLRMLHKIGFEELKGVTLTDNELRYILWRSYENLAEPGRYRSILGEAADVVKQHGLKVGNYAPRVDGEELRIKSEELKVDGANGAYVRQPTPNPSQGRGDGTDAVKKARIEKLRNSKPVDVKYNGEYALDRKSAKDWLKENVRGEYTNKDTGENIGISRICINEVTSHGSQSDAHLKSLVAIPQMIEQSIFIDEIPNVKGHDKYDSYRYYVCGLKIDGTDYTAKIVVGVKGDIKYYDHRLTEIEKGTLIDNLNGLSNSVAENENASISIGKDTKLASILQANQSKDVFVFAQKHNLNEKDVQDYSNYMRRGNLNGAARAFHEIRRKIMVDNTGMSLGEFTKLFSPVKKELYEKFGNIDDLREQYVQAIMEERNMMEAARKRAEETAEAERKRLQVFQDMTDGQLDEEYFKAVDANDESRLRDLVNEAARRNGYGDVNSEYQGVGAWSAPSNPGYENDEARRAAVESDTPDVNVTDIANGYSQQPSDYFTNLRAYGTDTPHGRESAEAINKAIADVRKGKESVVKVYRAVPKSVKEDKLRNGDWVTPSRKYADIHGNNRLEGDYRIIEQEVPARQLWWDGNDINEWGFDDGNSYVYRNTKNNRKLNDLITRDDKGDIIPLSQRFNVRKTDVRYRDNVQKGTDAVKKARIEKLRNNKPVEITGKEYEGEYELDRDSAKKWIKENLRGEYTNKDTGEKIEIRKDGAQKVTSHSMGNEAHLKSLIAIPQMIENSIFIDELPNEKNNRKYDRYRYYVCGLKIGDVDYTVKITVGVKGSSKYYDHSLTEIEKGKLIDNIDALSTTFDSNENASISIGKDTKLASILQANSSKIEDESGETNVSEELRIDGAYVRQPAPNPSLGRGEGKSENLRDVNERFNEELQKQIDGRLPKGHIYQLGLPDIVLRACGFPNMQIELSSTRLAEKAAQENHIFSISEVKDLVKEINSPWAVFRYGNNAKNVIVGIEHNGKQFLVGVHFNQSHRGIVVSDIRGIFPKDNAEWLNWITQGKADYLNKEKIQDLINKQRIDLAEVEYLDLDSVAKIVKDFENPTILEEENPDIRFRDGAPEMHERALARDRYEQRVKSGMYQTQEALQDSMLGLKEAMSAILGDGTRMEDVAGFENAYLGENRLSSVNKAEADAFAHTLFKPMLEEVARLAHNETEREELTDYMMAKHGLERNRIMAERNAQKDFAEHQKQHPASKKTLQDFINEYRERDYAGLTALTGMDNVADAEMEAQAMVDEYENGHDTFELWNKVNAVSNAILSKSYECGMMSKETYEDVKSIYEYYIPLRGFDEKTSAEAYAYLTHKQSSFNAPIKKAQGRKSKADDPFANLQSMAESAIMQGNRNKLVKQKFLNFALNHPSDLVSVSDLWVQYDAVTDEWRPVFPDNINSDDTPEEVEQKMQEFEEKMEQLAESAPDNYKRGKDAANIPYRVIESRDLRQHQVIVKRGGRDYVITINGNPRAAQALNGQTNPDNDTSGAIGAILRVGENINRQLSAFYTTRNPDFVVSNFVRDLLYTNTMAWIKERPNYALRFHRNYLMANPVMLKRLLAKYRNGTLDMSNKTEAMFQQFMMNGGETGYANIRDIEQHKNDIRRELKKANGKIKVARAWALLGERFDELNRAVENCARFAAFMTSREMGRTIDRAIYDAKEISVNFNKKGSGAKFLESVGQTKAGNASALVSGLGRSGFVFWNAAIQGTTNFGREFKRHPAKAFTGAATMFLLGAIIPYLGGSGDDDDDKNAYYNLPEYVRRSNILFRVGNHWVSLPLPVEYRAVYGMGELMTSVLIGKEHLTDGEIASAIAGQVSQILPIDFLEGGGGLNAFVPSAAKPLWEAYVAEKSWTGMPLYKNTSYNKDMPEWTKAYKSANKYIVGLANVMNEATGGDAYTKGAIDINPAKVEYMLNGYFGGVSGTIDKMTKMAETMSGERDYDPRSFLLVNRLVKAGDERTEYRAVNKEYFRLKEEHDRLKTRLRHYEEDTDKGIFDYAEKIDFLYNSPEYKRYEIFEDYQHDIDELYDELKEVYDDEERKQIETELNELKKEMIEEMEN